MSFLFLKFIILSTIIVIVSSAPVVMNAPVPFWHQPCGTELNPDKSVNSNIAEIIGSSLQSIKVQHQLTLNDYLTRDYKFLYEHIRIGVLERQYIPNWIPGTKDVQLIKNLHGLSSEMIANNLPKMHVDLQKFAVALEEMMEDEKTTKLQQALKSTHQYLQMMLCEVESSIVNLPTLALPPRVERSIMTSEERDPPDNTRRHVRDWGILLKYRNYLHAWRHVLDY